MTPDTNAEVEAREEADRALDAIEQRAMQVLSQHLEPHDCQWNLYPEAARAVVEAIRPDIQIQTIRWWAHLLEDSLAARSLDFEEVTPQLLRDQADDLQAQLDELRAAAAADRD